MVYDAEAYLTAQGWRGKGHSLHATSDAVGLSRPLLVSQKQNTLGVGKKQHRTSDMWWMNAFDKSLKGLDTSKEGTVVQTVTSGALDMVAKGGGKWAGKQGLYSCFVKGETLVGSVEEFRLLKEGNKMIVSQTDLLKVQGEDGKKRKRTMETKEERRWRKMEKRTKRAAKEAKKAEKALKKGSSSSSSSVERTESKTERKERKEVKRLKKAKKAAKALLKVGEADAKKAGKEDRKRLKKLAEETKKSK